MDPKLVAKRTGAPKHQRVRELLRKRIHQGIYLPGARVLTTKLCITFAPWAKSR